MASATLSRSSESPVPPDVRLMNATAGVLALVAALLLAAMAFLWLARQPLFAIRAISVDGDTARNSVSTIRANAAPRLAGNFLTMDLASVRRAFESVPWVRLAVVRRVWPNRLRVQLQEHRAVAIWGGESGNDKLVNSYGEVFEANVGDVEDDALPTLSGPDGSSAHALTMLGRIETALAPLGARVEELALSGRGSWQATLDSGAVVELGRGSDDEVIARAARFVVTLPQVTGRYQRPLAYADLRHSDGYAVRLKGVSTTTPPPPTNRRRNKEPQRMAKELKDLVVGLDIGTAKVMAVVAEVMPDGELRIAGLGSAPAHGLKRGVVVNIDATVQSIQQALKEAEMMADCKITRVYTGITGSHIRGQNSTGMVIVRDKEVTPVDVTRVVETAKAINIPNDQRLLLVEPQEFVIDGHEVKEPIGMSGGRLEVRVHIVTGAQSAAENIVKCVRRCGLEVEQLVLNPSASSHAVLTEDEKDLGVALVDIGAGTTDVAIFTDGSIRHTAVIPIAGDLITSDIAMALRTPTKDAEEIKVEYGVAKQLLADPNEQLEVPGLGDRPPRMLSRQALAGVIEPRIEEIYSLVHQVIRESGFEELLSSGIVITGGAAVMPGMIELGEDIFLKPVRKGTPTYRGALHDMVANPRSATVMGLLEEARMARTRGQRAAQQAGSVKTLFGRAKDWFLGNF